MIYISDVGQVNQPVCGSTSPLTYLSSEIVQRAIVYVPLHYLVHLTLQFAVSGCEHVDIDQSKILKRGVSLELNDKTYQTYLVVKYAHYNPLFLHI